MMTPQAPIPIPRDLGLPLPLTAGELEVLLVLLFLLHIVFVNLMVGGAVLTVMLEIVGLYRPRFDKLARCISRTITVNKSLAVVLGVGPLLCINLLYTVHFYSANALTGYAWIGIVPLVIIAFLVAYLHKYTWDRWVGPYKNLHIMVGGVASLLLLSIPLIFLANINLMLFPDQWTSVAGFFNSLAVGNVFPRYFHFLSASLAITGFFLAVWFGRKRFPVEELLPEFSRPELRRFFYRVVFFLTAAQLVFGPLLLLTLPPIGLTLKLVLLVLIGASVAILALTLMWLDIRSSDQVVGRHLVTVAVLLGAVVLIMGTGRHWYRDACLADHQQMIADRTSRFHSIQLATEMRIKAGLGAGEALASGPTGESVFKNCAACHAVDRVLAAPPLTEVYSIYAGNPGGIVAWAKNPGKKRAQFAPMPSFAHLGDEQLNLVARYILEIAAPQTSSGDEATSPSS